MPASAHHFGVGARHPLIIGKDENVTAAVPRPHPIAPRDAIANANVTQQIAPVAPVYGDRYICCLYPNSLQTWEYLRQALDVVSIIE